MGKQWKQWETSLYFGAPKSLWSVIAAMKLKDTCSFLEAENYRLFGAQLSVFLLLLLFIFIYFFILLYNTVLVLPYIDMNPPQVYMSSQSWTPLPPPTPYHLSGSFPCTSPKHPVSCIEHRLAIHSLHDSIHVSMPFSQIIPTSPSPSPSEFKSPLYTSVSLLLSCLQGHHCHLSKFHIYVLVYLLVFFFMADFTLYNLLQFHPSR